MHDTGVQRPQVQDRSSRLQALLLWLLWKTARPLRRCSLRLILPNLQQIVSKKLLTKCPPEKTNPPINGLLMWTAQVSHPNISCLKSAKVLLLQICIQTSLICCSLHIVISFWISFCHVMPLAPPPLESPSEISVKFSGWVRQDFKRPWNPTSQTLAPIMKTPAAILMNI